MIPVCTPDSGADEGYSQAFQWCALTQVLWGAGCFLVWGRVRSPVKNRMIASMAASYDLVIQTVGNWVAKYKKECVTDPDRKKASELAESAKIKAENRGLRQESEFLK